VEDFASLPEGGAHEFLFAFSSVFLSFLSLVGLRLIGPPMPIERGAKCLKTNSDGCRYSTIPKAKTEAGA
jgi:hypothetical protein